MTSVSDSSAVEEIDPEDCPFPLTDIDRKIIQTKDEDFHYITWNDLKEIISKNTLEDLKRSPSDLRRYLAWSHDIKKRYGGITAFVIQERLRWHPDPARRGDGPPVFEHCSSTPFADPRDYAILPNDWPYGFVPGIAHMLVWSKTPIAVDDERGDVTPASRKVIEDFVDRTFTQRLGPGGAARVLWFKNWVSLQSVRGIDHVHVLVWDPPAELLEAWTRRDP